MAMTKNQAVIWRRERGVHRYALVDKGSVRGIKGRDEQARDPSSRRHSLGDTKKDISPSGASRLSDKKTPRQAKNWPFS